MEFKYKLYDSVVITATDQQGTVFGMAIYATSTFPQYCIKYVNGQGDLVSAWFDEPDLGVYSTS